MPRVKLDYVVSVSSEDPEYQANNLLAGEVSKKKWLCSKNEQTCSVVLQLARAVTISAVHIGAQHAAFVEVLVGTSEKPNDQYEVLVPRCVFCTPAESRRSEPVPRVRSFSESKLAEGARMRRWDRVRVSCTQPYNKHCQFGLSFIHIFEPEEALAQTSAKVEPTPSNLLVSGVKDEVVTLGNYSSDDDVFQPGELFAKYREKLEYDKTAQPSTTDAQIRQASSQALKHITDETTKLKRAHIARSSYKRESRDCAGGSRAIAGSREAVTQAAAVTEQQRLKHRPSSVHSDDAGDVAQKRTRNVGKQVVGGGDAKTENRKRKRSRDGSGNRGVSARRSDGAETVEERALRGVVFAMSGYVHPERAALRDLALKLGARYRPDWTADCTHLVCAFPNTPKMKKVLASAAHAHVVSGGWLRECSARRRRVPEAHHSLHAPAQPAQPRSQPANAASSSLLGEQEGDTDDEIEKVRAFSRRVNVRASSASPQLDDSKRNLDDVTFVDEERIKGSVSSPKSEDESTEEEGGAQGGAQRERPPGELPDLLQGRSVLIAEDVSAAGMDAELLARYVRAYGGLPLREAEVEEETTVEYALCGSGAGARGVHVRGARVRADWLWDCHSARALLPTQPYTLPA